MPRATPDAEATVLALLEQAAGGGQPCPKNEAIAAAIGARSIATAARVVSTLEARGLITVERGPKWRRVTIRATGAATAATAGVVPGPRRADELAELVAGGMNLSKAAEAMNLSRQRIDQIWTWICAQLGPQAA